MAPEHGETRLLDTLVPGTAKSECVHTVDGPDDRDSSCTAPHCIQGREVSVNLLVEDLQDVDAGNLLSSLHTARQPGVGSHDGAVDGSHDYATHSVEFPLAMRHGKKCQLYLMSLECSRLVMNAIMNFVL